MSEATELQAARPAGPDLRAAAAGLSFKDATVPTPLADGWHAHRPVANNFREPTRFALFTSRDPVRQGHGRHLEELRYLQARGEAVSKSKEAWELIRSARPDRRRSAKGVAPRPKPTRNTRSINV